MKNGELRNTNDNSTHTKRIKQQRGITLLALVITIIILLILAGISISALTHQGLLDKANDVKIASEIANIKEQIQQDIYQKQVQPPVGTITKGELESILSKYGTINYEQDGTIKGITTENGHFINIEDILEEMNITESVTESTTNGIYAKLYSYNDGSGDILELSSNKDYKNTDTNVTLKQDYGDIRNNKYNFQEIKRSNEGTTYYYEEIGVFPPWLEQTTETSTDKYGTYIYKRYKNNTIKEVKIIDEIQPLTTACWFRNCNFLETIDVSKLNTAKVTEMQRMFEYCTGLTSINVSSWDTSNVTNMEGMFFYCTGLTSIDISGWNTLNVTNMWNMFDYCTGLKSIDVSNWNTSNVTNMSGMFAYCTGLTSINVSGWNTSNVTNMKSMFVNCEKLESIDVSKWDTSKVTHMESMFYGCNVLSSIDVIAWDTSNVTDMEGMFAYCKVLTKIEFGSEWDTSKVTNMAHMFENCNNLKDINVSKLDTSKVTHMESMFYGCQVLKSIDVSKWNTSNVTNMQGVFYQCSTLESLNLTNWNTSKVTNMSYMFYQCTKLTTINVSSSWSIPSGATKKNMFTGCGTSSVTVI